MLWRLRVLSHLLRATVKNPSAITIDPSNICNLKCPHCATGNGETNDDKVLMGLETFRSILEKVPFASVVNLFNWGEPFLNPEILQIIRLAKNRKIKLSLHSHFSFRKPAAFFDELVLSGLDTLVVSIDGATPETYQRYRIGGNFDLAVENLRNIVAAKKRNGTNKLQIIWSMLINKFNELEVEKAHSMATEIGVKYRAWPINIDFTPDVPARDTIEERKAEWLPKQPRYLANRYKNGWSNWRMVCPHLFQSPVISPAGKVFPCCFMTQKENSFGDLKEQSFEEIWNGGMYRAARSLFVGKPLPGAKNLPCASCTLYTKHVGILEALIPNSIPISASGFGLRDFV